MLNSHQTMEGSGGYQDSDPSAPESSGRAALRNPSESLCVGVRRNRWLEGFLWNPRALSVLIMVDREGGNACCYFKRPLKGRLWL